MSAPGETSVPLEMGTMRAMLVMLDSMAPSPCHEFAAVHEAPIMMPKVVLNDVLSMAGNYGGMGLPLVVSTSSRDALTAAVIEPLVEFGCEFIVNSDIAALLESMAAAPFLNVLDGDRALSEIPAYEEPQSFLIHVGPETTSEFAAKIHGRLGPSYSIAVRTRDLHRYDKSSFLNYEQQMTLLGQHMLESAGGGGICVSANLSLSPMSRCGAGTSVLTVAPDGYLYPCPAFYRSGRGHSLGSVHSVCRQRGWDREIKRLCGTLNCTACAFLHAQRGSAASINELLGAEERARASIARRALVSDNAWRGLCSLELATSRGRSQYECREVYSDIIVEPDLTADVFQKALTDIHTLIRRVSAPDQLSCPTVQDICERWLPMNGERSGTRLAAFRARVREAVEDLVNFRCDSSQGHPIEAEGAADGQGAGCIRLKPEELKDIQQRYNCYLGWYTLLSSARSDNAVGIPSEGTDWMEAELKASCQMVQEWFLRARRRYGLHADNERRLKVDFEKGTLNGTQSPATPDVCGKCPPNSALYLSDMETEFIHSLVELQGALVDQFRGEYQDERSVRASNGSIALQTLLNELGDTTLAIHTWYRKKAQIAGWPNDAEWSVDVHKKMLHPDEAGGTSLIEAGMRTPRTSTFSKWGQDASETHSEEL